MTDTEHAGKGAEWNDTAGRPGRTVPERDGMPDRGLEYTAGRNGMEPERVPDGGLVQNMQRCWEDLAQAVILQAAADYREARETLRRRPDRTEAQELQQECERFFTSLWFAHLNNADGEKLLRRLREQS